MRTIITLAALCLTTAVQAHNWQYDYAGDRFRVGGRNGGYRAAPADHWGRARSSYFRGLAAPKSSTTTNPNYVEPEYVEPVMIYNPFVENNGAPQVAPAPAKETAPTFKLF